MSQVKTTWQGKTFVRYLPVISSSFYIRKWLMSSCRKPLKYFATIERKERKKICRTPQSLHGRCWKLPGEGGICTEKIKLRSGVGGGGGEEVRGEREKFPPNFPSRSLSPWNRLTKISLSPNDFSGFSVIFSIFWYKIFNSSLLFKNSFGLNLWVSHVFFISFSKFSEQLSCFPNLFFSYPQ